MKLKFFSLFGLLLLLLFAGCATTLPVEPIEKEIFVPAKEPIEAPPLVEKSRVVKIIATGDIHGAIFPYDFIKDEKAATSQLQIASYIEEQRSLDQEVILLDNGDVLQGQPVVYYYNFIKPNEPHIVNRIMNQLGYDAASVGEVDIQAGPEVYVRVASEANYPYLGANIVYSDTKEPALEPYTIIERDGIKIGVLGLITPSVSKWVAQNLYQNIEFEDMVKSAQKWMPHLLEEKPDLVIGLFHSGSGEVDEDAGCVVAQKVAGFDLIITGCDHKESNIRVEDPNGKEVPLIGAIDSALSVATASALFSYDTESERYTLNFIETSTEMMESYPIQQELLDHYQDVIDEVKEWLSTKIGSISETISSRDSMFGDSKFVDLIHRIQLQETDAELSISAPLSFDATIAKGDVYVRDMFNLYPSENLLFTLEMSGQEIKDFIEYSYGKWFNQMKSLDDDLILFQYDDEGSLIFNPRFNNYETTSSPSNWDSLAGVNYVVDITKPIGQRVTLKTMSDGTPFKYDKTYLVAMNSYRALGGGGHLEAANIDGEEALQRRVKSSDKDLRYYLMQAFLDEEELVPTVDNNWLVIPNLWVQRGIKSSYPKLYPKM